jgi:hypothetical protein
MSMSGFTTNSSFTVALTRKLRVGPGMENVEIGPLVSGLTATGS